VILLRNFLKIKQILEKPTMHIAIFELQNEEESVLTLFHLFKKCGYKVSLFLSDKIWSLIKDDIKKATFGFLKIYDNNKTFIDIKTEFENIISIKGIDIIVFTHFYSYGFHETRSFIDFFKNHKTIVGVFNYNRWFSSIPPIKYNGWRIVKRSEILDWFYCHYVFKYISNYFISEIHIESNNPLKLLIRKRCSKKVFDFPFKLMINKYNPDLEYEFPTFVVPGAIDKTRRDYLPLLKIFDSTFLRSYKWRLILLGRPIGNYGQNVIDYTKKINSRYNENRIMYVKKYVSKEVFDEMMNKGTHILAPIKYNQYKFGKDSGALYDVFKYNKVGIFKDSYFYDSNLVDKDVIITYKKNSELKNIIYKIVTFEYLYDDISVNFNKMNYYFNKNNYIKYINRCIENIDI